MIKIDEKDINALMISKFFLSKKKLTPKKIQKLVYYAYAWFITLHNEDENHIDNVLFEEIPEAWLHGPVFPSLYREYKEYNWNEVPKLEEDVVFDNDDLMIFLNEIWEKFGVFSGDELEHMTHQETPWKNARNSLSKNAISNNKISLKDIFIYYNAL